MRRKRCRNPFGFDLSTLAILGGMFYFGSKLTPKAVTDNVVDKAKSFVGGLGDTIMGRSPNFQFANVQYETFLTSAAPEVIRFTLNHKGSAGNYLVGAYLQNYTWASDIVWDRNTIVSMGEDADWVGYPVTLSSPVNLGPGTFDMHLYVRQGAYMYADERQFGKVFTA